MNYLGEIYDEFLDPFDRYQGWYLADRPFFEEFDERYPKYYGTEIGRDYGEQGKELREERGPQTKKGHEVWRPRCDVYEDRNGNINVEFELPGVPLDDIHLTVTNNILTLRSRKPKSKKESSSYHYISERHWGDFFRRAPLPFQVAPQNMRAFLGNGVLKIIISKSQRQDDILE